MSKTREKKWGRVRGTIRFSPLPDRILKEYELEKEDAPKRAELRNLKKDKYLEP